MVLGGYKRQWNNLSHSSVFSPRLTLAFNSRGCILGLDSVRILVLQESDWIERGPHQSHHLLERMVQRGHEVHVVDFEIGWRKQTSASIIAPRKVLTPPPKVIQGSEITVVRPMMVRLPALEYTSLIVTHRREIRREIQEFQPDVVLGFGLLNAFVGIRLARRAGIPFLYYLIEELHRLVPQRALRGLARLVEQSNVRRASAVLSINQALREYALEMGASPERANILPAGVDLGQYSSAQDGSAVRKRHGLEPEDLVLFFMGWVYPFAGLREVAESLAAGDGCEARAKLLVVGKGESWDGLARLATERGLEDRIKMIGFRPYTEMPSYLSAADVCLLPAYNTATMRNIVPIKMYEYLAAGKAVIATRLPGLVKEFGEGNGVVYVDGPPQVVPKAAELARAGELGQIGQRGRAFVSKNDWEKITNTFEGYLRGLVDRTDASH